MGSAAEWADALKVEIGVAVEPCDICVQPTHISPSNWNGLLDDALRGTTMENLDLQSRAEIARLVLNSTHGLEPRDLKA